MKKSSKVSNIYSDSYFKRIYVQNILSWQQSTINVWNEMNIHKPVQVPKVKIVNEANSALGFVLDIDESNSNGLTIQKYDSSGLLEKGVVYDTEFNKPEPAVLGMSPSFMLPEQQTEAGLYLRNNPNDVLCLMARENTIFEFPSLPTWVKEPNRQVRILNMGNFLVQIKYSGEVLVELFQERVSFIWRQENGRYTWVYIP
jgi:hypothetical protein